MHSHDKYFKASSPPPTNSKLRRFMVNYHPATAGWAERAQTITSYFHTASKPIQGKKNGAFTLNAWE